VSAVLRVVWCAWYVVTNNVTKHQDDPHNKCCEREWYVVSGMLCVVWCAWYVVANNVTKQKDDAHNRRCECERYVVSEVLWVATRKASWKNMGVEPGNQKGPGC